MKWKSRELSLAVALDNKYSCLEYLSNDTPQEHLQIYTIFIYQIYCDGIAQGIAQQWSRGTPAGDVRQQ
jgi:hypothetical protein